MNKVRKYHDKLDEVMAYISSFFLFIMMFWIFMDVVMRNVFKTSITGTLEITGEYLMVVIVYFSLSYTLKNNGHVSVDILENWFSVKVQRLLSIIVNILALLVFISLGYYNLQKGIEYFANDIRSRGLLEYPLAPALMIISLGIFSMCLRLIFNTVDLLKKKEKNDNILK